MIAFLRDLRRPKELIPKLRNLKKLKTHSGNYLGMQYGILPTISDLEEIVAALKKVAPYLDRNGWQSYTAVSTDSMSSGRVQYDLVQRIKLAIEAEDDGFKKLASAVDSAGFALTLENVWDLIPYSFVLDWFLDIGEFLERCDSRMRLMRQNIRYATMSSKRTTSYRVEPTITFPYQGSISRVHYTRWTEDHSPVPPLFFQNTNTVSNHWLEASALIHQRTK
jgi:hypothetical protein